MIQSRKRRGFVLIMAILTLPIVVVSMESVASLAASDMHRTYDVMIECQTEQLLFAGALAAKQDQTLSLPPSLATFGARVEFSKNGDGATVTAHLEHTTESIDVTGSPSR